MTRLKKSMGKERYKVSKIESTAFRGIPLKEMTREDLIVVINTLAMCYADRYFIEKPEIIPKF